MESVTKPPRGRRYALSGETALKGYSSHMKKKKGDTHKKTYESVAWFYGLWCWCVSSYFFYKQIHLWDRCLSFFWLSCEQKHCQSLSSGCYDKTISNYPYFCIMLKNKPCLHILMNMFVITRIIGQCSPCNVKMWIRVPESVWARGLC